VPTARVSHNLGQFSIYCADRFGEPPLGTRIWQVQRCATFVEEIRQRSMVGHAYVLRSVATLARTCTDHRQGGSGPGSPSIEQLMTQAQHATTCAELDIESFYLFAKILLDRLAGLVEFYFGPARRLSLASHDALTNNIEKYLSAKNLPALDPQLQAQTKEMRRRISDFRDYCISHDKAPGVHRGMSFTLAHAQLHVPSDKTGAAQNTEPVDRLYEAVGDYFDSWIAYLTTNGDSRGAAPRRPISHGSGQ
jgi:hypothetical protein